MTGVGEIAIIGGSVLGILAGIKGAKLLNVKFQYKYSKKIIYRQIKKNLKKGDFTKFQQGLQKLKQFDIDHEVDKYLPLLEKLGVPEEITDSIDDFTDFLENKKNDIIELLEVSEKEEKQSEENQMVSVLEESINRTFEINFHKLALPLKQINEFDLSKIDELPALLKLINEMNLTDILEDIKQQVKDNVKKEIPKEMNLDKMFQAKMKSTLLRQRAIAVQKQRVKMARANNHGV